jgi:pimeloyl-ACP methyl ester carboxylesterase
MVEFLRRDESVRDYRIDPDRIALVGHSMGGGVALVAGAGLPAVRAVVSIAGADLGSFADLTEEDLDGFGAHLESTLSLHVPDGRAILEEIDGSDPNLSVAEHAAPLAAKALLFVNGRFDQAIDPRVHLQPLTAALEQAGAEDVTQRVLDADHAFSSRRIALARTVVDWLAARL